MIHGYKKNKRQKSAQEKEQEEILIEKINAKLAEFFQLPRQQVQDKHLPTYLEFISLLMQLVSDIPTVFNFRRELVQKITAQQGPEDLAKTLGSEIKLTTKLIQSDPKSYTLWTYRQWLVKWLFGINSAILDAEKELTKLLLIKDEKNFHVWNYRNWLNSLHCNQELQLGFTEQKIKSNPFNFSPYHFRSKLLQRHSQRILQDQKTDTEKRKEILTLGMTRDQFSVEIERVRTAVFLNPNEEAPWLYYNWLLGQLLPAFIIDRSQTEKGTIFTTNIKVSSFQGLLVEGNLLPQTELSRQWFVEGSKSLVLSNLERPETIRLESTGNLFLGEKKSKEWIQEHVQSHYEKELSFIDEVIESEQQTVCRYGYLQKATIYRWLIESGCGEGDFQRWAEGGLRALQAVKNETKAHKYILKQLQSWERLTKGDLSQWELKLKKAFV